MGLLLKKRHNLELRSAGLQSKGLCDTMRPMLTKKTKEKVIKTTARHAKDTGSAEVQVALLSRRIDELALHLKKNLKDNHSRRGLLQMVADRRTHLKYLKGADEKRYAKLVKDLNLKLK